VTFSLRETHAISLDGLPEVPVSPGHQHDRNARRDLGIDRSINDGKLLSIPVAERSPDGGFVVTCVCGQTIPVPGKPDAVSAEREGDLRVNLGE
jgi:hypothetical protein